jgi:alkanesulfonate monooxygenase SsuD/methylene tetrahydromethanopterin reductase-like flavin-dependent oxidoreductase (luciferase family)
MTSHRISIGMSFDRQYPAHHVTEFASRLEAGGADELWVIEDCFYTAGVSLAAAALAATEKLTVGIGILPARARTAAITAMEFATLCALAPGRVLPGIGHGVQSWMAQMGVRPASPLRALDEVLVAVRRLLAGEEVSVDGEYVYLDKVQLDQPPLVAPPVLAGVRQAKSLAVASKSADGVVLDSANPHYVLWSIDQAGQPPEFYVAAFTVVCVQDNRHEAYRVMAPWLADQITQRNPNMTTLPFFDDLEAWHAQKGATGLASIPAEWWAQIAAVGTFDDAVGYITAMADAGVKSLGLWSAPDVSIGLTDIDIVTRLAAATR